MTNDFFVMNFAHYCHIQNKIFLIFKLQAHTHNLPFINVAFMSSAQVRIHYPINFSFQTSFWDLVEFHWIFLYFLLNFQWQNCLLIQYVSLKVWNLWNQLQKFTCPRLSNNTKSVVIPWKLKSKGEIFQANVTLSNMIKTRFKRISRLG
jgi:hypothetical protein